MQSIIDKLWNLLDGNLEDPVDLHIVILLGTYLLTGAFCIFACFFPGTLTCSYVLKIFTEAFVPTTITLMFSVVVETYADAKQRNTRTSTLGFYVIIFLFIYGAMYGVSSANYSFSWIRNILFLICVFVVFIPCYLKMIGQMKTIETSKLTRKI